MTVKRLYKHIHKAFPSATVFLKCIFSNKTINGGLLAIPSSAMSAHKHDKVVKIEWDEDVYTNEPIIFFYIDCSLHI